MATMKLAKSDWHSYFDRVGKSLRSKEIEIEVASLSIGDQIVAKKAALTGITFEPKGGDLTIITDSIEHRIPAPIEIYVQETGEGLVSAEVVDNAGTKHIVTLTPRLMIAGNAAK